LHCFEADNWIIVFKSQDCDAVIWVERPDGQEVRGGTLYMP